MGRLHYGMMISLDGFIRDASGSTDWMLADEELHGFASAQDRTVGTRVYGRGLWETMRYWQSPPEEDLTENGLGVAYGGRLVTMGENLLLLDDLHHHHDHPHG